VTQHVGLSHQRTPLLTLISRPDSHSSFHNVTDILQKSPDRRHRAVGQRSATYLTHTMLPFPIVHETFMPIVRPFHKVDLRFPIQFGPGVGRECTDPGLVSFGLPLRPLVCGTGILWGSRMSSVAHNLIPNTPNVARRLSTDHHRSTRWGGCRKRRSVMCKSALQNGCVCEVQKPRQSPPLLLPPSFAISCYQGPNRPASPTSTHSTLPSNNASSLPDLDTLGRC
jgi:hypothetical protein